MCVVHEVTTDEPPELDELAGLHDEVGAPAVVDALDVAEWLRPWLASLIAWTPDDGALFDHP